MTSETGQFYKSTFENLPEEKRKRIITAATEEFANNGFENTSIQQIAKKSNISVGSIYKYFQNKKAKRTRCFTGF